MSLSSSGLPTTTASASPTTTQSSGPAVTGSPSTSTWSTTTPALQAMVSKSVEAAVSQSLSEFLSSIDTRLKAITSSSRDASVGMPSSSQGMLSTLLEIPTCSAHRLQSIYYGHFIN